MLLQTVPWLVWIKWTSDKYIALNTSTHCLYSEMMVEWKKKKARKQSYWIQEFRQLYSVYAFVQKENWRRGELCVCVQTSNVYICVDTIAVYIVDDYFVMVRWMSVSVCTPVHLFQHWNLTLLSLIISVGYVNWLNHSNSNCLKRMRVRLLYVWYTSRGVDTVSTTMTATTTTTKVRIYHLLFYNIPAELNTKKREIERSRLN